ncbi:hypothetical protein GCM10009639_41180 [Kitasatospora putterlickiae]|uniref:Uncharacterized protein n=1 Tax=Kitasatospora putterlickiae TaxID=221725 RepID=A0ABN1Y7S9_9ACTN
MDLTEELRRRTEAAATPRLAARPGTLLRRTVIRHTWDEARLLPTPDPATTLLLTPVADYLLGPADRTAALAALHHWDAAQ